jgi:hypothetical protein
MMMMKFEKIKVDFFLLVCLSIIMLSCLVGEERETEKDTMRNGCYFCLKQQKFFFSFYFNLFIY